MIQKVGLVLLEEFIPSLNVLLETLLNANINKTFHAVSYEKGFFYINKLNQNNAQSCYVPLTENLLDELVERLKDEEITTLVLLGGSQKETLAKSLQKKGIATLNAPFSMMNCCQLGDYTVGSDTFHNNAMSEIDRLSDTGISHKKVSFVQLTDTKDGRNVRALKEMTNSEYAVAQNEDINDHLHNLLKNSSGKEVMVLLNKHYTNFEELVEKYFPTEDFKRWIDLDTLAIGNTKASAYDRIKSVQVGKKLLELLADNQLNKTLYFKKEKLTTI